LALIEAALEAARKEYGEAQGSGDREALAKVGRDLRYWTARRATAHVVVTDPDNEIVQFGTLISGRSEHWGECSSGEANPSELALRKWYPG
jgi:transcription elongation GreA/GreB family factor